MRSGLQEVQAAVKTGGSSGIAEEIRVRDYVMGLEVYRELLEQARIAEENEEERRLLRLEIGLIHLELEALAAERAGDRARVEKLLERIRKREALLEEEMLR